MLVHSAVFMALTVFICIRKLGARTPKGMRGNFIYQKRIIADFTYQLYKPELDILYALSGQWNNM